MRFSIPILIFLLPLANCQEPGTNIFLTLTAGPDRIISQFPPNNFRNRTARITALKAALERHAAMTQKPIQDFLSMQTLDPAASVTSFWISNQVYIRGANSELVSALEARFGPILSSITEESYESLSAAEAVSPRQAGTPTYTWGVSRIQAPQAWALAGGNNGANAVVGGIDTGVRLSHEALKGNYFGPYGWYDPNEETKEPNDQNGHGTHTMGTVCGAGGIGVAPGASWIACKGCEGDSCAQADLLACGQFMLCPTLPDRSQADCSKAPGVINNSWGGTGRNNNYATMIRAWRAGGIVPVFALGNSGPACGTAGSPGDYTNVIGVKATTANSGVADFSSRGPANGIFGFFGDVKPDVAGPGQAINSSWYTSDGAYNTISGTSMAAPHTTGVVALILAARPSLTYDQVKDHLLRGCTRQGLRRPLIPCEVVLFTYPYPNNEYGQGLINALNSLRRVINA